MARVAKSKHRDKRRGYFYCYVEGKRHYLGMDEELAEAEFQRLTAPLRLTGPPLTVAEVILHWSRGQANVWQEQMIDSFDRFAGTEAIRRLPADALQQYAHWLRTAETVHPKTGVVYRNGVQTIRHKVTIAHQLCQWAVGQGWLYEAPEMPNLPTAVRMPKDLSPEELARLSEIRSPHARPMLAFILATGCRPGEARLLEWRDVRLDVGSVTLGRHKTAARTGRPRTIYFTRIAEGVLRSQRRQGRWVFPSSTGRPYSKDGLRSICYRAGFTPYQLRHTFAQKALEEIGFGDLAMLLGHVGLRMVQIYAQVRDARARQVAQALEVPELPARATVARGNQRQRARGRRSPKTRKASPRKSLRDSVA